MVKHPSYGQGWVLSAMSDPAHEWLCSTGLYEPVFGTRTEAVRAVIAQHAITPAPPESFDVSQVKVRRKGPGHLRVDGGWDIVRCGTDPDGLRWHLRKDGRLYRRASTLRQALTYLAPRERPAGR